MRLPLDRLRHAALLELLARFDELGCRAVLIGGLVPPLLLQYLDPDGFATAPAGRRTADCDLVLDLAIGDGLEVYRDVQEFLAARWTRDPRANQFRWNHHSGLRVDLIPVPAGIERQDLAAIGLAELWLPDIDVKAFYRGQEFAISTAIDLFVLDPSDVPFPLRIAGLAAMLTMKIQAWNDSYRGRKRDAHDVAWLLRYLDVEVAVRALRAARALRSDLVDHVVNHLRRDFSDEESAGVWHYVAEAFPDRHGGEDEYTEADRNAVASAVQRLLAALDGRHR